MFLAIKSLGFFVAACRRFRSASRHLSSGLLHFYSLLNRITVADIFDGMYLPYRIGFISMKYVSCLRHSFHDSYFSQRIEIRC